MSATVDGHGAAFPPTVFEAPLFRGFDARAEREIEAAGRIRALGSGEVLFQAGDEAESFFVVASGRVALTARRRGDDEESVLRVVHAGETFGEEAIAMPKRKSTATAGSVATVAEIPVHIFRRAAVRSGKADLAERLERTMRRAATRDLLRTSALTRDLSDDMLDVVLDEVSWCSFGRGEPIYRTGDAAEALFLVAEGRIQIQTDDGARLRVRGYLGEGDFFGDEEISSRARRGTSAVASGPSTLLSVPARVVDAVVRQDPGLFDRLRRMAQGDLTRQANVIGAAAANATAHVFRDLYRLEIARSLLVIDLESCVRCGHCTWTCGELHGTPRLVRRGDKIVTRSEAPKSDLPQLFQGSLSEHLMLPSSCQHCENPACMVDCPTGAIGKDAQGEVFIREELCTGCGACARACPWDNIQMAPRLGPPPKALSTVAAEVAVKCDLCREYASGPACVEACPTAAISRIDPSEDLGELRALLGRGPRKGERRTIAPPVPWLWIASAAVAASALAAVGVVMHARHLFSASHGIGYAAGVASTIGFGLLLAYAIPKRLVKLWKRRRTTGRGAPAATRSLGAPWLVAHIAIGCVATALALVHAPLTGRGTPGQTLLVCFLASSVVGLLTALAYVVIPRRLARIERTALLPEDFAGERQALFDRLYRGITGKNDAVKKLCERVLVPYAKSRVGSLVLLLSGRDLRQERSAVQARLDTLLEGRGRERLGGIDELLRIVVELRALPAQRALLTLLRVGVPLHVCCFSVTFVLLLLHVAFGVGR